MKLITQVLILTSIFGLNWSKAVCPLGIDLFNDLLDEPYTAKEGFGVDRAIGIVSSNDPLPEHNLSQEQYEACMKKYFEEQKTPSLSPFSPLLTYHRPSYLGVKPPNLDYPDPPSSYSIPKEGYTTYQHPYNFLANMKSTKKPKGGKKSFFESVKDWK